MSLLNWKSNPDHIQDTLKRIMLIVSTFLSVFKHFFTSLEITIPNITTHSNVMSDWQVHVQRHDSHQEPGASYLGRSGNKLHELGAKTSREDDDRVQDEQDEEVGQ